MRALTSFRHVPVRACWLWLLGLAVRMLPVRPLGVVGSPSIGDKSGDRVLRRQGVVRFARWPRLRTDAPVPPSAATGGRGAPGEDVRRLERLVVEDSLWIRAWPRARRLVNDSDLIVYPRGLGLTVRWCGAGYHSWP
jgi:hypothetical protein